MAHLVAGIDIGSHSVKCVCIDSGFRRSRVADAFEIAVPPGDKTLPERQMEAVRLVRERLGGETMFFVALPGDKVAIRALDLPFADRRKVEQVVPYELEGQIVSPLEEVVYAHKILDGGDETTPVVAAAAKIDDVGVFLDRLTEAGVTPRSVFVAPLVYRLAKNEPVSIALEPVESGQSDAAATPPAEKLAVPADLQLLLDIGEEITDVIVLRNGEPLFSRTLMRGGKHLTEAIAQAFTAPIEYAEDAKRQRAIVAHAAYRPTDATDQKLAIVTREALAPWLRDVRQTLAGFRGRLPMELSGFSMVGGGALLRGLGEALAEELGLTCEPFAPPRPANIDWGEYADLDVRFALAEALAVAGTTGLPQIDLRKGPFVYRASFSVVRQRAWHIVALAAGILLCLGAERSMAYSRLHKQHDKLEADLEEATTELFGKPDKNAKDVALLLKQGFREEMPPIPAATAFDLLADISKRLPASDAIKLDFLEMDIRPKKTFFKGLIDSVASVDKVVDALKQMDCFEDISKGAITEVSGGDKQFTLTIKAKCP